MGEEAEELWNTMISGTQKNTRPVLSDVEVPRPEVLGETDRFVLFDSKRDYLTQLDYYHMWRDGDE